MIAGQRRLGKQLGAAIAVLATACSSSSTTEPMVAGSDAASASPQDAAASAALVDVADAGAGCFKVTGSGAAQDCAFSTCALSGSSCANLPASEFGSCPTPDLYGCCIESATDDAGKSCVTATCFYTENAGRTGMSNCLAMGYLGQPVTWQTTSP